MDPIDLPELLSRIMTAPEFLRASFAGKQRTAPPLRWQRVDVRPIELRGSVRLQFVYFDGRETHTQNPIGPEVSAALAELAAARFAGIHLESQGETIDVRISKKGDLHASHRKTAPRTDTAPAPHNRVKVLPLPEDRPHRVLQTLGIQTAAGLIRPTMRAKFTQINEFLKQFRHALDATDLRALGRPVRILDCGCGASYLTLALHYDMVEHLQIPAEIFGIDLNEKLIRQSTAKAEQLRASGLEFVCGRIGEVDIAADVVVALHACDTATDDALAQAIRSGARMILSVPCCHHELNQHLKPDGPAEVLRPLLRYGLLRERMADLFTDAFRALILRLMGYRVEVVEFVSAEHTTRNLMLRCTLGGPTADPATRAEYDALKTFVGVEPYLAQQLKTHDLATHAGI